MTLVLSLGNGTLMYGSRVLGYLQKTRKDSGLKVADRECLSFQANIGGVREIEGLPPCLIPALPGQAHHVVPQGQISSKSETTAHKATPGYRATIRRAPATRATLRTAKRVTGRSVWAMLVMARLAMVLATGTL